MISADDYHYKSWHDEIQGQVNLYDYAKYTDWKDFFGRVSDSMLFRSIENKLTEEKDDDCDIFPYPKLVFRPFELLELDRVKVVIIGQDPYPCSRYLHQQIIPDAMGVSFSVPVGHPIPESLQSIQDNLQKFIPMYKVPKHGNLEGWVVQGCLMLNTSMTVKKLEPNSHAQYWKLITDKIIKYVSSSLDNVVFVLWGADALTKMKLIDMDKHQIIISSHPSFKSRDNPLQNVYSSFSAQNHFGLINDYLIAHDKTPIIWQT